MRADKAALHQYKHRVEEWDAKQAQWQVLHEELATANMRIRALEEQLSHATAALHAAENKPPALQTVTAYKV